MIKFFRLIRQSMIKENRVSKYLLYAIGDNEGATRLAGVRYWQVIIVLYILSALLAGVGGLLYIGLVKANTLSLAVPLVLPSVAAAVTMKIAPGSPSANTWLADG